MIDNFMRTLCVDWLEMQGAGFALLQGFVHVYI